MLVEAAKRERREVVRGQVEHPDLPVQVHRDSTAVSRLEPRLVIAVLAGVDDL